MTNWPTWMEITSRMAFQKERKTRGLCFRRDYKISAKNGVRKKSNDGQHEQSRVELSLDDEVPNLEDRNDSEAEQAVNEQTDDLSRKSVPRRTVQELSDQESEPEPAQPEQAPQQEPEEVNDGSDEIPLARPLSYSHRLLVRPPGFVPQKGKSPAHLSISPFVTSFE